MNNVNDHTRNERVGISRHHKAAARGRRARGRLVQLLLLPGNCSAIAGFDGARRIGSRHYRRNDQYTRSAFVGIHPGRSSRDPKGCLADKTGDDANCSRSFRFHINYGAVLLGTGFIPALVDAYLGWIDQLSV